MRKLAFGKAASGSNGCSSPHPGAMPRPALYVIGAGPARHLLGRISAAKNTQQLAIQHESEIRIGRRRRGMRVPKTPLWVVVLAVQKRGRAQTKIEISILSTNDNLGTSLTDVRYE